MERAERSNGQGTNDLLSVEHTATAPIARVSIIDRAVMCHYRREPKIPGEFRRDFAHGSRRTQVRELRERHPLSNLPTTRGTRARRAAEAVGRGTDGNFRESIGIDVPEVEGLSGFR